MVVAANTHRPNWGELNKLRTWRLVTEAIANGVSRRLAANVALVCRKDSGHGKNSHVIKVDDVTDGHFQKRTSRSV